MFEQWADAFAFVKNFYSYHFTNNEHEIFNFLFTIIHFTFYTSIIAILVLKNLTILLIFFYHKSKRLLMRENHKVFAFTY